MHLQYLGFPILNDPLYNHWAWGNERFHKGHCTKPTNEILKYIKDYRSVDDIKDALKQIKVNIERKLIKNGRRPWEEILQDSQNGKYSYDNTCYDCLYGVPEPKQYKSIMWLHAHKYKGPDWDFTAALPDWAIQ